MSRIIATKRGTYSRIELDDGRQVLIELNKTGMRISLLKLSGLFQGKTLCVWDAQQTRSLVGLLAEGGPQKKHPVEAVGERVVRCRSMRELAIACEEMNLRIVLHEISPPVVGRGGLLSMIEQRDPHLSRDTRIHPRYRIGLPMRYIFVNERNRHRLSPIYRAQVRDISFGGVSFLATGLATPEARAPARSSGKVSNLLMTQIYLSKNGHPVVASAKVVHGQVVRENGRMSLLMGMQFDEIDDIHRESLHAFLQSRSR